MKSLCLILFICLSGGAMVFSRQPLNEAGEQAGGHEADARPELQLETNLVDSKYCRYVQSTYLALTLRLSFTNIGTAPVILDKNSAAIGREMVSRTLADAAAKKYEYDARNYIVDLREAGGHLDSNPPSNFFIPLKPIQSL